MSLSNITFQDYVLLKYLEFEIFIFEKQHTCVLSYVGGNKESIYLSFYNFSTLGVTLWLLWMMWFVELGI